MVHYPFIYLYYAWVKNNDLTFEQSLPGAAGVVAGSIVLAYICLKFYDVPVRKYLTERFLKRKSNIYPYP
jgi:peptidoglycan/LPS O-acetylase OafA/YrhL